MDTFTSNTADEHLVLKAAIIIKSWKLFFLSLDSTWSNFHFVTLMDVFVSLVEALRSPKQQSIPLGGTFTALCDSSFKTLKNFGRDVSDILSWKSGTWWRIFISVCSELTADVLLLLSSTLQQCYFVCYCMTNIIYHTTCSEKKHVYLV